MRNLHSFPASFIPFVIDSNQKVSFVIILQMISVFDGATADSFILLKSQVMASLTFELDLNVV